MSATRGELTVKTFLEKENGQPEIRRFAVDEDVATSFTYLVEKISLVYPSLKKGNFKLYYKDIEDDMIAFSSDDELTVALTSVTDGILRVFLRPSADSTSSQPSSGTAHPGVTCDGCESPVVGTRFKCVVCPDYDLCGSCQNKGLHTEHFKIPLHRPVNFFLPPGLFGLGQMFGQRGGCPRGQTPTGPSGGPSKEQEASKETPSGASAEGQASGGASNQPPQNFTDFFGRMFGQGCSENANPCGKPAEGATPGGACNQPPPQLAEFFNQMFGQRRGENANPCGATPGGAGNQPPPNFEEFFGRMFGQGGGCQGGQAPTGCPFRAPGGSGQEQKGGSGEKAPGEECNPQNFAEMMQQLQQSETFAPWIEAARNFLAPLGLNVGDYGSGFGERKEGAEGASAGSASGKTAEGLGGARPKTPPSASAPSYEDVQRARAAGTSERLYPTLATDPRIQEALEQMKAMGFSDDGGWLTNLIIAKNGDIGQVLDILKPAASHPGHV